MKTWELSRVLLGSFVSVDHRGKCCVSWSDVHTVLQSSFQPDIVIFMWAIVVRDRVTPPRVPAREDASVALSVGI